MRLYNVSNEEWQSLALVTSDYIDNVTGKPYNSTDGITLNLSNFGPGSYMLVVYTEYTGYLPIDYTLSFLSNSSKCMNPHELQNLNCGVTDTQGTFTIIKSGAANRRVHKLTLASVANATINSYVKIEFDNSVGDLDLRLYDSTLNLLLAASVGNTNVEQISLKNMATGIYYVVVQGKSEEDVGTYTLKTNFNTNECVQATEKTLTCGNSQSWGDFTLDTVDNEQILKFNLTSRGLGNSITITRTGGNTGYLYVYLYNSTWGSITSTYLYYYNSTGTINLNLAAGEYYLVIRNNTNSNAPYTIKTSSNGTECLNITDLSVLQCGITKYWGTYTLTEAGILKGHIYKFKVNAPSNTSIGSFLQIRSTKYLYAVVYDKNWTQKYSTYIYPNGHSVEGSAIISWYASNIIPGDEYYLVVYASSDSDLGSYRLLTEFNTNTCLATEGITGLSCGLNKIGDYTINDLRLVQYDNYYTQYCYNSPYGWEGRKVIKFTVDSNIDTGNFQIELGENFSGYADAQIYKVSDWYSTNWDGYYYSEDYCAGSGYGYGENAKDNLVLLPYSHATLPPGEYYLVFRVTTYQDSGDTFNFSLKSSINPETCPPLVITDLDTSFCGTEHDHGTYNITQGEVKHGDVYKIPLSVLFNLNKYMTSYFEIEFNSSVGDLDLSLYTPDWKLITSSTGNSNFERILINNVLTYWIYDQYSYYNTLRDVYLVVYGKNSTDIGTYKLKTQFLRYDCANITEITELPLVCGTTDVGQFELTKAGSYNYNNYYDYDYNAHFYKFSVGSTKRPGSYIELKRLSQTTYYYYDRLYYNLFKINGNSYTSKSSNYIYTQGALLNIDVGSLEQGDYILMIYWDSKTNLTNILYTLRTIIGGGDCASITDLGSLQCDARQEWGPYTITTSGEINGDNYKYTLSTQAHKVISSYFELTAASNICLKLFDSNMTQISNRCGTGKISLTNYAAGTYYLLVYGNGATGSYSLAAYNINDSCIPHNDQCDFSNSGNAYNSCGPYTFRCNSGIGCGGYYWFGGGGWGGIGGWGGGYYIGGGGSSGGPINTNCNYGIAVYKEGYWTTPVSQCCNCSSTSLSNLPPEYNYYLVVYYCGSDCNTYGCCNYTIHHVDEPPVDNDLGTLECGVTKHWEQTYNVAEGGEDKGVVFKFRLSEQTNSYSFVMIEFDNSVGNLDMALFDSSWKKLSTIANNTNVEVFNLNGRPAGEYYLVVYGRTPSDIGNFNLTTQFQIGVSCTLDETLNLPCGTNTLVNKVLINKNWSIVSEHRYKLNLTSRTLSGSGSITIRRTTADGGNNGFGGYLYYQNGTSLVMYSGLHQVSANSSTTINLDNLPLREYWLVIHNSTGVDVPYTITSYWDSTSCYTIEDLGSLQCGQNITIDNTYEITQGGKINGKMYKFTLDANADNLIYSSIWLTTSANLYMELYNSSWQKLYTSSSNDKWVPFNNRAAGDYYLLVYGNGSATGQYTMSYQYNTKECFLNKHRIETLPCGIRHHGDWMLTHPGVLNAHVFSFTLGAVGVGSFQLESNSNLSGYLRMAIYNKNWKLVSSSNSIMNLTGLNVGDYYLVVYQDYYYYPIELTYSLWSLLNVNNCREIDELTGPTCGVGKQLHGNYNVTQGGLEDAKIHSFVQTESNILTGNIELDYSNAGTLDMWLYDSVWNLKQKSSLMAGKKQLINLKDLTTGSYYIVVFGVDDTQTGPYTLSSTLNTYSCNSFTYDLGVLECAGQVEGGVENHGTYNLPYGAVSNGMLFRLVLPEQANPSQITRILIEYASSVGQLNAMLFIKNNDGTLTHKTNYTGTSTYVQVNMKNYGAGEYYLLVYGNQLTNIGNFTLKSIYNTYTCYASTYLGYLEEESSSSESSSSNSEESASEESESRDSSNSKSSSSSTR
jgi:hypothetical protein